MDLPPDPYLALGVPKDATQAAVKTAHRKLVLKCHPDKVTDPDAKQAAADKFHKIQTAYEILIDEDRRGRYDAQVRLAGLRKEAMDSRPSAGATRSSYKSSHEASARPGYATRASERMAPQYEERRPSYAAADYFDTKPRSSPARKEPEYERPSKRSEPKEKVRTSTRDAKESERERRKEKTRKTDRDTRKEREAKHNPYIVDESESDSDEYARRSRRMREEDAMRKAREAQYEDAYRHRKESAAEPHDAYTRKMDAARDHIQSSRTRPRADPMEDSPRSRARTEVREETERRPSAARMSSSKDKVEYMKGRDGRPAVVVRRASEKPKSKDVEPPRAETAHRREPERRSSAEKLAERRPPMLNTSKSSPSDIRIPGLDKQRSQSVQADTQPPPRVSPIKRSETFHDIPRMGENTAPTKSSNLRQTEFSEGLATPATTPDNATSPQNKYNYGRQYADDAEYATPDGYRTDYRTEVREPGSKSRPAVPTRMTRSPSPMKEARDVRDSPREREDRPRDFPARDGRSARTSSARYPSSPQPAMPPRTTSYMYSGPGQGVEERPRPGMSRAESMRSEVPTRDSLYYGEVPTTKTASPTSRHRSAAVDEGIRYAKAPRPEDIKVQSGYSSMGRRAGVERPMYTRTGSGYSGVKA